MKNRCLYKINGKHFCFFIFPQHPPMWNIMSMNARKDKGLSLVLFLFREAEPDLPYLRKPSDRKYHHCHGIPPVADPIGQENSPFTTQQDRLVPYMSRLPYGLDTFGATKPEQHPVRIGKAVGLHLPYSRYASPLPYAGPVEQPPYALYAGRNGCGNSYSPYIPFLHTYRLSVEHLSEPFEAVFQYPDKFPSHLRLSSEMAFLFKVLLGCLHLTHGVESGSRFHAVYD